MIFHERTDYYSKFATQMTLGLGGFAGMFYQSYQETWLYVIQTILECRKGKSAIYEASINLIWSLRVYNYRLVYYKLGEKFLNKISEMMMVYMCVFLKSSIEICILKIEGLPNFKRLLI